MKVTTLICNFAFGASALGIVSLPAMAQEDPPTPMDQPRPAVVSPVDREDTPDPGVPESTTARGANVPSAKANAGPAISRNSQDHQAAEYEALGLPAPEAPTAERPYYYVRFDGPAKNQYFEEMVVKRDELTNDDTFSGGLIEMLAMNKDRLVVVNFYDERNAEQSSRQTELLSKALTHLTPRSRAKQLMLIDVVVRDRTGEMPYGGAYHEIYEENMLGVSNSPKKEYTLPYGVIYGKAFKENASNRLYDFGLYNGVKTSADLDANSRAIVGVLLGIVDTYNKRASTRPD